MPSDPASPLHVAFTPEFKRNLRQLAKKYRHIKSDLQPILDQLAKAFRHPAGDSHPFAVGVGSIKTAVTLRESTAPVVVPLISASGRPWWKKSPPHRWAVSTVR